MPPPIVIVLADADINALQTVTLTGKNKETA